MDPSTHRPTFSRAWRIANLSVSTEFPRHSAKHSGFALYALYALAPPLSIVQYGQYVSFSAKLPGFGNVNGLNSRACIAPQVSNEKHGVVEEAEGSS